MSETLKLGVSSRIPAGPTVSIATELYIDAYDKIGLVISAGKEKEVEIQPNDDDKVLFLIINSNHYADKLSYRVNDSADDIVLDTPQVFIGKGSISRLSSTAPRKLKFKNDLPPPNENDDLPIDNSASIEILVGRNAVTEI